MKQKQIGFEFEIGSPWGLRKTCNKMKEDLNLPDLKIQHDVTVDTHARYKLNPVNEQGRLLKKSDQVLEDMLFARIEKEII